MLDSLIGLLFADLVPRTAAIHNLVDHVTIRQRLHDAVDTEALFGAAHTE